MTDPKTLAVLIAVALATSGCDLADRLEGKSPNREWIERREANEAQFTTPDAAAPVTAVSSPAALISDIPDTPVAPVVVLDVTPTPEPVAGTPTTPVIDVCLPQFLVRRCGPNGEFLPW